MEVKLPIRIFVIQCSLTQDKKLNNKSKDFSSPSLQAALMSALPHLCSRQMIFTPLGEHQWSPCSPDSSR